ncbi:hypothetical protein [Leeuwenhoekiella sp. MAR_2009_132]|uniref:hypothetical protein n=1 Tax=Leeuwenhoekiella sp. MAR_2009_132 TaxID=1392489 RepID=UPI00068DBCA0|nr:hypothetical protein [Leeuwenhoekiella sp. MAR_2009_132]
MGLTRKLIQLKAGIIEFTDFYALGIVNPDINFDENDRKAFLNACLDYFNDQPFGYISVRNHSYSINPLIYLELNKIDNLRAFAIVSRTSIGRGNAKIEGQFFNKPFGIFETKRDAEKWINAEVKKSIDTN